MDSLKVRLIRPKTMQQHNAYVILELLKRQGPISRADISRTLGFSKSAVSGIVALLFEYDLVRSSGKGDPHTGRKSELIEFNPGARHFVSVALSVDPTVFAVVDLSGMIVTSTRLSLSHEDPDRFVAGIAEAIEGLMDSPSAQRSAIEGVGLTVPGLVDTSRGTILFSRSLRLPSDFSLSERLSERLKLPVALENDANALALGEGWVGRAKTYSNWAYLYLAEGVGVGGAFVTRNALLTGVDHAACEFGKIIVNHRGGAIKAEEALLALLSDLRQELRSEGRSESEIDFALTNGIGRSAPAVGRTVDEILRILAQMVADIVVVLNPEVIFINSPYLTSARGALASLRELALAHLPEQPPRTLELSPASLEDDHVVVSGAGTAIYQSRFRFIVAGAGDAGLDEAGDE